MILLVLKPQNFSTKLVSKHLNSSNSLVHFKFIIECCQGKRESRRIADELRGFVRVYVCVWWWLVGKPATHCLQHTACNTLPATHCLQRTAAHYSCTGVVAVSCNALLCIAEIAVVHALSNTNTNTTCHEPNTRLNGSCHISGACTPLFWHALPFFPCSLFLFFSMHVLWKAVFKKDPFRLQYFFFFALVFLLFSNVSVECIYCSPMYLLFSKVCVVLPCVCCSPMYVLSSNVSTPTASSS